MVPGAVSQDRRSDPVQIRYDEFPLLAWPENGEIKSAVIDFGDEGGTTAWYGDLLAEGPMMALAIRQAWRAGATGSSTAVAVWRMR